MRGGKREWRKEGGREKDDFCYTFIACIVIVWSLFITFDNDWKAKS